MTTAFRLSLTVTGDATLTGDDVHRALSLTGADLANRYDGLTLPDHLTGTVRNADGQPLGTWSTEPQPTAEQIADSFAGVGHALDWESGPKRRAYLIQAVRIARGEV